MDLDSGRIEYFSDTQLQKSPRTISLRPGEDFGLDIEGLTKNHVFGMSNFLSTQNQTNTGSGS